MALMATDCEDVAQEVEMTSDNELNMSQNSSNNSMLNQSVGSVGSVDNEDNKLNNTLSSIKSKGTQSATKRKRKLTPKEREERDKQRSLERERKAKELQEKKEQLERERQREKEKKEKERQEKETEKQRLRDEKQREKDEKQKERDEKQKEKDLEKLKKQEEMIEKKRKTDDEKKKAIEEKEKKEEKQRKILKNFFIKRSLDENSHKKSVLTNTETKTNPLFGNQPIDLAPNQTIAPVVSEFAKKRFNRQLLDRLLRTQDSKPLYFDSMKDDMNYKIFKCNKRPKTEPEIIVESNDNEDNQQKRYRVKHIQFHQNVRPPYRGTFRKSSAAIKPIKPFIKDSKLFDYEVDSDEEWEEGGEGESINGSESDGSVKDDYEIDNDLFVPHGYLSEDENDENEDQMNASVVKDIEMTDDNVDPNREKSAPLLKEQVLMAERNRSFSKSLTPIVVGCVWESSPDVNQKLIESFQSFKRMSIKTK